MALPLLLSVFVVATCGLIYELIAGTVASYLLGDSVTQFSTVIGTYLFAMGVGSYFSKYLNRNLLGFFIQIELLVGVIGGCSAALLFLAFEHVESLRLVLYPLVFIIGALIGLEIPLLLRILKDKLEFRDLVSSVLSFDYVGALVASILFPLVLAPYLGLMRTSFLFGILNVLTALWILMLLGGDLGAKKSLKATCFGSLVLLVCGFVYSNQLLAYAEAIVYPSHVIYAKSTPYQRVVLTQSEDEFRLYLNGHLQFSSRDEYRYHEALVHPVMQAAGTRKNILVLGGGDGLALREIFKYSDVERATLVDLDPAVTDLFAHHVSLSKLNRSSLSDPKLTVINADAFVWLRSLPGSLQNQFDVIIVDLPDPTNYSLGKLYTTTFYNALKKALAPDGAVVIQSTSPLFARKSYWCVANTLEAAGLHVTPYHMYVPSFGEWGYVIGKFTSDPLQYTERPEAQFLTPKVFESALNFPSDMSRVQTEPNRLDNQLLVHYYDEEWGKYGS